MVVCRHHWQKLKEMTAECAMQQYIETLDNVDPGWRSAPSSRGPSRHKKGGAGGPVFSTLRDPSDQEQQVGHRSTLVVQ